jgi:exosortase
MPKESLSSQIKNPVIWPAFAIFLGWTVLITQLRHHWGGESYYNFGWFVPALTLWLFYRNIGDLKPKQSRPGTVPLFVAIGAMLIMLPFQALSEVNPFWRVPLWAQALCLVGFSLAVLYSVYGKAGIRAGIFPFFFLCTMIPWPYRIELMIVQALTKVVVSIAMDGIHLLGYPVELAGNSFVLGELQIGVNEACSGIRSLQALFMVTLFLGSLFGQGNLRRLLAVAVLPVIVILVNSARAIFLSLTVIVQGDEAYQAWHDPAGYIAFGVSMILIYACIELLNIGGKKEESDDIRPLGEFIMGFKQWTRPAWAPVLVLLPLFVYSSVEGWFLIHERTAPPQKDWELAPPETDSAAIEHKEIHPQIAGILGYSYGQRIIYRPGDGSICELYYYGYTEENKLESVSSYGHSPLICMEAIGATKVKEFPDLLLSPGSLTIPMKHYLFELNRTGDRIHVFWVVWEKRNQGVFSRGTGRTELFNSIDPVGPKAGGISAGRLSC